MKCRLVISERLDEVLEQLTEMLSLKGIKPIRALQMLKQRLGNDPEAMRKWLGEARVASILGSCPRSKDSFRSGVRHWLQFVETTHGADLCGRYAFPPAMTDVLAWANLFQCSGDVLSPTHAAPSYMRYYASSQAPSQTTSHT